MFICNCQWIGRQRESQITREGNQRDAVTISWWKDQETQNGKNTTKRKAGIPLCAFVWQTVSKSVYVTACWLKNSRTNRKVSVKIRTNELAQESFFPDAIHMHLYSDPDLSLPMDIVNGTVLVGSISGDLKGGATLDVGFKGQALSTNGKLQYADFGSHRDQCYHNPDMCNNGVSFSLWLYTRAPSVLIDTGGCLRAATGYGIVLRDGGVMRVFVKTEHLYENYVCRDFMSHEWTHIVTTWGPGQGINLYIDGCDVKTCSYTNRNRTNDIVKYPNILVGTNSRKNVFSDMLLDELHVWYDILTPDQVWQLYLHGGRMDM